MRPYSLDLRERVLADFDAGLGTQAVAEKYRVSTKWIRDLRRLREETGGLAPRHGKVGAKPKLAAHSDRLVELVEAKPDATLEELQRQLPISAGLSTIWRALRALGFTLKKSSARGGTATAGCAGPPRCLAVLAGCAGLSSAGLSR